MNCSRCLVLLLLSVGCSSRGTMDVTDSSVDAAVDSMIVADGAADAVADGTTADAAVDAPMDSGADGAVDDATVDAAADATGDAAIDARDADAADARVDAATGCGELGLACMVNTECETVGICSVEVGHCIPGRRPGCSESEPCTGGLFCVRWHVDESQGTCLESDEIECSCGALDVAGHICP